MKDQHNLIGVATVLLTTALSLHSCTQDYFEMDRMQEDFITWEPDLAIPLVKSDVTVEDIIGQADTTNIYEYDEDNFITAIYRRRVFSQTINDLFPVPASLPLIDTKQLTATEVADFIANGQVSSNFSNTHSLAFLGNDAELEHIRFFVGSTLRINVMGDIDHGGTLVVTFPELRLNGVPLTRTVPLTAQSGSTSGSVTVDVTGYEATLNTNGSNSVPVQYQLTLLNGGGVPPTTVNQLSITNEFQDGRLSYADGYFGQFNLAVPPNDVNVDLFEGGENEGTIYFEDPRLRIRINNSFGVPFQGQINSLIASGEPGVTPVNFNTVVPGGVFNIPASVSIGDTVSQEYLFDQDNSNIKPIVNDNYDSFVYDMGASGNDAGQTFNFATLNSVLEVIADVELPFHGRSDHFTVKDTIDSPLTEVENLKDNIQEALLRISTLNGLPADAIIKLYMADSLYNVTDSVLANGEFVARSGPIDSDGRVITPMNTNNDIPLDSTRVETLFGAKYLIYHADITSTDDAVPNIRIYGDDQLDVRIGLRAKLKASPTDLDEL